MELNILQRLLKAGKMLKVKAFTLIELLVVVAIIGILTAVGVVAYNGYTATAKDKATQSNLKSITNYLLAEFTKCEADDDQIILQNFKCNQSSEPDISLITGFFNQNMLFKNPYNINQSALVSSTPCSQGQIAITKPSKGVYSINYYSSSNNKIQTNTINTKWVPVNTGTNTTWTSVNTGCSTTWSKVNTGNNTSWKNVKP